MEEAENEGRCGDKEEVYSGSEAALWRQNGFDGVCWALRKKKASQQRRDLGHSAEQRTEPAAALVSSEGNRVEGVQREE